MKLKNNKQASLVLISLLLVGFLLVLGTGILKVILTDAKDTYSMKNSLKAFYGAESGLELGLLRLKIKGFGYNYEIKNGEKRETLVLASGLINSRKDVIIDYQIDSKAKTASGTIKSGDSVIYPLFYKTGSIDFEPGSTIINTTDFTLTLDKNSQTGSLITRGLIGSPKNDTIKIKGINGTGSGLIINKDSEGTTKYLDASNKLTHGSSNIKDFLTNHSGSYLQIGNLNKDSIEYKLNSREDFTGEFTTITASARIGKNKQNIKLTINNSKYLNIFRFTLYDPN